jgi:hypothetical protein
MSPSVKLKTPWAGSANSHCRGQHGCRQDGEGVAYLLAVGGRRRAELVRIPHDLVILLVRLRVGGALALAGAVGGGAKVLEAGLAGEGVETPLGAVALALALAVVLAGHAKGQGRKEEERGSDMHVGGCVQVWRACVWWEQRSDRLLFIARRAHGGPPGISTAPDRDAIADTTSSWRMQRRLHTLGLLGPAEMQRYPMGHIARAVDRATGVWAGAGLGVVCCGPPCAGSSSRHAAAQFSRQQSRWPSTLLPRIPGTGAG